MFLKFLYFQSNISPKGFGETNRSEINGNDVFLHTDDTDFSCYQCPLNPLLQYFLFSFFH